MRKFTTKLTKIYPRHCMRLLGALTLAFTLQLAPGCHQKKSVARQRKEQIQDKQTHKEELREKLEDAKKKHRKMQDKETRKRMKRMRRKSERYKGAKKEPFWKRWFRKSPR